MFVHVPNMPRCDGAVYLAGDAMAPLLKGGDIIMYRRMENLDDIFWGEMYLLSVDVAGDEYVTVRYVHKSARPGYIKLSGYDSFNDEKEIEISKVRAIAFVKATIRMNSIM